MSKVTCIDVSYCQTNVNYDKVKSDGIEAVIIRAGYGRELSQKDSQFETHYKNATAAGLKVGAYWYSYADSVDDAKKEAATCLACIKGKKFDMPIYFDMEESFQTNFGKAVLTSMAKAFCEVIKAGGYEAGVYSNLNWFNNYLNYDELKKSYSIWLAQYYTSNGKECDIWQNSSTGKIAGMNGNVDTNVIFNRSVFSSTSTSASSSNNTSSSSKTEVTIPDAIYKVRTSGRWLPEVKNLTDYAGIIGKSITDVAIKFTEGICKYRVMVNGQWLPYVTGYNTSDYNNGYAGNGKNIEAVEVYYNTPDRIAKGLGYLKAKYRVSPVNKGYYAWQYDNETTGGQDGYAGYRGIKIDRFQLTLSK